MVTTNSFACRAMPSCSLVNNPINYKSSNFDYSHFPLILLSPKRRVVRCCRTHTIRVSVSRNVKEVSEVEIKEEEELRPRFRWVEVGSESEITESQEQAISQLPPKMEKRCKAMMKQIICFNPQTARLSLLLSAWVTIMKPRRADWLSVLKELKRTDHPLLFEVTELALLEDSFEANVRDYTKLTDGYGKKNRLKDAENTLMTMKKRGFPCDQVILSAMLNMYSKAGDFKQAEKVFEEIKLLGEPLDQRSYGSMIMAYIRAGKPNLGYSLLKEMDSQDIYAGSEVYKAMLRSYSMAGDCERAESIFKAIQFAGIIPDARLCGLLITAYAVAGQSEKARLAFENMRRAGLEPSDKCVALVLSAYEKENYLYTALEFLIDLERDGIKVEKEASEILAGWFGRLGVVNEVDLVLREYAAKGTNNKISNI